MHDHACFGFPELQMGTECLGVVPVIMLRGRSIPVWLPRIANGFVVGIAGFDIPPARSTFLLLPEHVHGADTLRSAIGSASLVSGASSVRYRNGRSLPHYYNSAPKRARPQ